MATAPYQLWIDGPTISTGVRSASTVTITTTNAHGMSTGSYVEIGGAGTTGAALGMNGIYQITVTGTATFTYTSAGTAGTGIAGGTALTTEYFSHDLLNPLINYSGTARDTALYIPTESLQMSMSGDGEPATFGFTVNQDDSTATPWFNCIPDNARLRLVKADTGSSYVNGSTIFRGWLLGLDVQPNGSGLGTITTVNAVDVNALFDRVVIYGTLGANYGRSMVKF